MGRTPKIYGNLLKNTIRLSQQVFSVGISSENLITELRLITNQRGMGYYNFPYRNKN